ncbi:uncharacterized protein LOC134773062 [Penaeus indicus]|uniref:uncharacterized protein LOC134773062 n=1 Tax=Penaeus indicus TaxID=29960 RepID=UPI00300D04FC
MLKWRVRSPLSFLGCEPPLQASPANARAEDEDARAVGVQVPGLPAVASSSFSAPATPVPNRSFLHRAFVPTSPASIGIAEALGFYDGGLGGKKAPAEDAGSEASVHAGSQDGGGRSQGQDGEVQDDQKCGALPRESHCQDEGQGEGKQAARGQGQDQGQGQAKLMSQTDAQLQDAKPLSDDANAKSSPTNVAEEKVPDSHYSQPRNNKPITSPETGTLPRPPPSKPLLRYFFGTMDNHIGSLRNSNERRGRPNAHAKESMEDRHYAQPRSNKCVNCKKNSNAEEPVTRRVCGVKSLPLTLERKKSKSTFYVDVPDISSPKTTDRKSEQRNCCCAAGCGRAEGDQRDKAIKEESGKKLPIDPSDLYSKPRKRRGKPGNPPGERAKSPAKQCTEPQKNDASNRENEANSPPTKQCSEPKNQLCDSVSHYSEPRKTCIEVKPHQSESVSHYSAPRRHSKEPKNLLVESVSHYSEPRKQSTEPKNPVSEASSHYSQPRKTMSDSANLLAGPRAQCAVGVATQTSPEDFVETLCSKRLEGKSQDESTRATEKTEGGRCQTVEAHEYEPLDVARGSENHLDDALDFRDALGYMRAREIRKLRGKSGKEEGEEKTKHRKQKTKDKEGKNGTGRGKKGGARSKEPSEDPAGPSKRSRRLTRDEIVRKLKSIYRIEPSIPSSPSSSTASPPPPTADKNNDASTSSSVIRPCYNTFPRPRPRPRPATQTSPLISSESIPDGAYVDLFPVLNMSALQLAAEGRDYLMWCPDQEFDHAVAALDIRNMSALQLAAEGRDYLMWCPDQEFDHAVAALDIRRSREVTPECDPQASS